MAAISQQLADITVLSIVVRILLSTFCAGTLGFERERHNQAAGFRTYIIVSDASALVMMTNIFVAGIGETDLVRNDLQEKFAHCSIDSVANKVSV